MLQFPYQYHSTEKYVLSTEKLLKLRYFGEVEADFKVNLRAELDFLGLTVKELSAKTGIAKRTLDCYFGARASMPPADIAVKIAEALGVTVEFLVTGQEAKQRKKPPDNRLLDTRLFDGNTRSAIQILAELGEKDVEIMLGLARVLKKQSEKSTAHHGGQFSEDLRQTDGQK